MGPYLAALRPSRLRWYQRQGHMLHTRCVAVAASVVTVSLVSFAQSGPLMRVRVLNARSGKPLKGVGVFIVDSTKTTGTKDPAAGAPHGVSDAEGVVVLTLPMLPPDKVFVWYSGGQCGLAQCSYKKGAPLSTAEILKAGVVAPDYCFGGRHVGSKVSARPGELVIFAAPLRSWECMAREIP
jgi:hypothetical protein